MVLQVGKICVLDLPIKKELFRSVAVIFLLLCHTSIGKVTLVNK